MVSAAFKSVHGRAQKLVSGPGMDEAMGAFNRLLPAWALEVTDAEAAKVVPDAALRGHCWSFQL
eukprot:7301075-Alexandrium_andersonii.AAC.1